MTFFSQTNSKHFRIPSGNTAMSAQGGSILVSLDGGQTFSPANQGVRIIYTGVPVPGEDSPGELHVNATVEGLISDLWVSRDGSLDHNLGTCAQSLDDLVEQLVDDPAQAT